MLGLPELAEYSAGTINAAGRAMRGYLNLYPIEKRKEKVRQRIHRETSLNRTIAAAAFFNQPYSILLFFDRDLNYLEIQSGFG